MKNPIRRYRKMSFEQKTVFNTVIGLCLSSVLAVGKFVIGLFADYNLCIISVYTFAILLAKLECLLGIKTNTRSFKTRNILISVFLILSSAVYICFMGRMFFIERTIKSYRMEYVLILAFISFVELGFAITGIIRMKDKGHFYRNIKIINFCIALIAILTTQIAILDFTTTANTDIFNAYSGIGVGVFIAICAVYVLFAQKISVIDRERNIFNLEKPSENLLIDMSSQKAELILCKSKVYGSFIYSAVINCATVEGNIVRGASLWKRMHLFLKIVCCILSEILIFVWLFGRLIFFLRSINLPARLENLMHENGFQKINV